MTTTVQVSDDGGSTWRDIDYQDFQISVGLHDIQFVPTATITSRTRQNVATAQPFRIQQNGTTIFEGETESPGTVNRLGQVDLQARHRVDELFGEQVSLDKTGGTFAGAVLTDAKNATENGGDFILDIQPSDIALDEYVVENRSVRDIYLDIADRTGWVLWVDPATTTITVQQRAGRGTWQTLDAQTDGIQVNSYNEGSIETVVNDVAVTVTEGEGVTGTATDQTSIDTYGKRSVKYNYEYAATQNEADQIAQALLQPTPLAQGELVVPRAVGDLTQPLVNYTVDFTDATKGIDVTGLLIEQQTIEQGRATLKGGEGSAQAVDTTNRKTRSREDKTVPGSVINTDRLADDSVDTQQLVDTAVIEQKLADLAVTTNKLQNNAVINGKLDDLSVSETKIQDDSIATPKLQAEAVTASEIAADTITASEIAAGTITALEIAADTITADEIAAGTITALEIAADQITANEIDVLDLNAEDLSITFDGVGIEFDTFSSPVGTSVYMRPTGTREAELGDSNNLWNQIWTREVNASETIECDTLIATAAFRGVQTDEIDSDDDAQISVRTDADFDSNQVDNVAYQRWTVTDDGGDTNFVLSTTAKDFSQITTLYPTTDNEGRLGSESEAFQEMNAHAFNTQSAPTFEGDARGAMRGADYGTKRLPKWVLADEPDTEDLHGPGADAQAEDTPDRINLGRMDSWLLSVCQAQDKRIEELEGTVADLEERLRTLESQR